MSSPDNSKDYTNNLYEGVSYYTASMSPHLQGVELSQLWQIAAYTNIKIRNNAGFITTLNGVPQMQNFFDETLSGENLGISSSGSQVNLDTSGKFGSIIDHRRETRDFGLSIFYEDGNPFSEKFSVETNPSSLITQQHTSGNIPSSLQKIGASPSYFDGVIEAMEIRQISDRTSKSLKNPIRSIKGSLSAENVSLTLRDNCRFVDMKDLRDNPREPWIDRVRSLGNKLDLPSSASHSPNSLYFFNDSSDRERTYYTGSVDPQVRDGILSGLTISSSLYNVPRTEVIGTSEVYARRGFDFSQADNYRYDSIAFAGLSRTNRI